MIGKLSMAFKIKAKYVSSLQKKENSKWSNEISQFTFTECDDNFLKNNNYTNSFYIQPERIKFCNIFNICEQTLTIDLLQSKEQQIYTIEKGIYTAEKLNAILNTFNEKINFEFKENEQKMNYTGKCILFNKYQDNDVLITMNRNLLLNLGLLDTYVILQNKLKYNTIGVPKSTKVYGNYDLSRSIQEIKLYSKHILNYKTELCHKTLSPKDFTFLNKKSSDFKCIFNICNLNCKSYKVDRFNLDACKFYFLDFFEEIVSFDYCEMSIFVYSK